MLKEERHTGSFEATGEDGGKRVIHIFTAILDAGTRGDPNAEIPGLRSLKTDDGETVNRLEKRKYQVVATGEILRSDDPDAP